MKRISTHWDGCEESHHECALEQLREARRSLSEEHSDWIPCAERLPELTDSGPSYVLATIHAPGLRNRPPYTDKVSINTLRSEVLDAVKFGEVSIFTAWKPMPAPWSSK